MSVSIHICKVLLPSKAMYNLKLEFLQKHRIFAIESPHQLLLPQMQKHQSDLSTWLFHTYHVHNFPPLQPPSIYSVAALPFVKPLHYALNSLN